MIYLRPLEELDAGVLPGENPESLSKNLEVRKWNLKIIEGFPPTFSFISLPSASWSRMRSDLKGVADCRRSLRPAIWRCGGQIFGCFSKNGVLLVYVGGIRKG